ncbi:hypothetical protein ADL00_34280 [Streptomyces sp. AS58]|nr:hypothetical protein ADL00_34280 [Streptomyces sp. AS58]
MNQTRIFRKCTECLFFIQLLLQSWMLWTMVKVVPEYSEDDYDFGAAIFVSTIFLWGPYVLADAVMAFKTRLATPSPTGWWSTLTSSPTTTAVCGVLVLCVAVLGIVLDAIRG